MKKLLSVVMALLLCVTALCGAMAEEDPAGEIWALIAGEDGTTYVNLFSVILDENCYAYWYDRCAAVAGEAAAADMVAALQGSISSELYGEAATQAFGESPQGAMFDCFYINGLESVTFQGDTATVVLTDGTSQTHTYEYIGQYMVGAGEYMVYYGQEFEVAFPCEVFRSTDEAGEFTYFFLRDDTMAETYHIEFRYGSDLEALQGYFVGPYAYWLTAGIDADADAQTIANVIDLFCLENMDYSAHTEASLAQLSELGLVGEWTADLSAYGEAYAEIDLRMTIDADGHGVTKMNGAQTADFEAYAYDSGEKGDGAGLYVAYSNLEYEAESAPYTLEENGDGALVLILTAEEGSIRWVKQTAVEISTAEELAAIAEDLNGSYVLTADIDLAGIEWAPIGTFVPSGENEEEAEIPDPAYAFTGSFDGNGHTVSNLRIDRPEDIALGLFGCISGAEVRDLTVADAQVDGALMMAAVVGYAYDSSVSDITLLRAVVTAHPTDISNEGMIGGIVGAGMGSSIADCYALADVTIPDGTANAGLVGGGLELCDLLRCKASGVLTAGDDCYGLGGVAGCAFGANLVEDCTAEDLGIHAGDNAYLVGGIVGYTGGFATEEYGVPITDVHECAAVRVRITTGADPSAVGAIVGGGFYFEEVAQAYGGDFASPTIYTLTDCEPVTVNGEAAPLAGEQ